MFCFDRNFPGHKIITAILDAGGHVVARVRAGISLPVTPGGWLSDGSRLSYLNAPSGQEADRLPVRVTGHNAVLPCGDGEQVSETCTLRDNVRAGQGHHSRRRGPHVRAVLRSGTPRLAVQEFRARMCGTQLVRASAAAVLAGDAAHARELRRRQGSGPVTSDQLSFTAGWHSAIRSMTQSRVTATTSLPELAALADATARAMLQTLSITGRQRHSVRAQKHQPRFAHTARTKKTVTGFPEITLFAPDTT